MQLQDFSKLISTQFTPGPFKEVTWSIANAGDINKQEIINQKVYISKTRKHVSVPEEIRETDKLEK